MLSKNRELTDERGCPPDSKKLAEATGIKEKIVKQITGYYLRKKFSIFDVRSYSEQLNGSNCLDSLIFYEDQLLEDPEKRLAEIEQILNVAFPIVDRLIVSDRLPKGIPVSEIIKMYYGFNPYKTNFVLRDLAQKFSISPEGIRLIIARYQNALGTYLNENIKLDDLLPED